MHRIVYTVRRIAPNDVPRDQSVAIEHLGDNLYSCAEQEISDDDEARATGVRSWRALAALPGEIVSAGDGRYGKLPPSARASVMRSEIFRAPRAAGGAQQLVADALVEQAAAAARHVGLIAGEPLLDVADPALSLDEAERQVALGRPLSVATVRSADVDSSLDLVRRDNIVPHVWSGERA